MTKPIQTLAASLRHAAWTGTPAQIGGGKYNREECAAGAAALELYPDMLAALRKFTSDNRADNDGSTVAFLVPVADYEAARAILARIDGAPTAQPAAPISEAGERCASCGAEEGESHGAQCEARGFAMGADARRLDTGALRSVTGDDADWLEATASRDGGEC